MNKIVMMCSCMVLVLSISACTGSFNKEAPEILVFPNNFDSVAFDAPLEQPYSENFEGSTVPNVQDFASAYKWAIVNDSGKSVLKCVDVDEKEINEGINIFSLMIGDKAWKNYAFSFDFKLPSESWVTFAPFADSNADNNTPDNFDSRNPWSLLIDSDGVLLYQTVFGHGTHYIGENSDIYDEAGNAKSKPVEGYVAGGWNHIELIPAGSELTMSINGTNIGKVADIHENESGRVSIGGGLGCMFDNLTVAPMK